MFGVELLSLLNKTHRWRSCEWMCPLNHVSWPNMWYTEHMSTHQMTKCALQWVVTVFFWVSVPASWISRKQTSVEVCARVPGKVRKDIFKENWMFSTTCTAPYFFSCQPIWNKDAQYIIVYCGNKMGEDTPNTQQLILTITTGLILTPKNKTKQKNLTSSLNLRGPTKNVCLSTHIHGWQKAPSCSRTECSLDWQNIS